MPRLRMPPEQQAIFDDLRDFVNDARMINAPQLARDWGRDVRCVRDWGRDVRCVRDWLRENRLPRIPMGNGYGYMIRDVSWAMYVGMES